MTIGNALNYNATLSSPLPIAQGGTAVAASKPVIQTISNSIATVVDCATVTPVDNTIPQQSESQIVLSVIITPTNSANTLQIDAVLSGASSVTGTPVITLFQDSGVNALAVQYQTISSSFAANLTITLIMTAGTTSATTFKVGIGVPSGHFYVNGDNSGLPLFGGKSLAYVVVQERAS